MVPKPNNDAKTTKNGIEIEWSDLEYFQKHVFSGTFGQMALRLAHLH